MSTLSFVKLLFVLSIAGGVSMSFLSLRNLSSEGQQRSTRVFWLGAAAGRRYFSDKGWRYRQAAIVMQLLAAAAIVGWAMILRSQ